MARTFTHKPTTYTVTGVVAADESRTSWITSPGMVLTAAEVCAAILGGETGPAGWDLLLCDRCGDTHEWCPDLRAVLGFDRPA